MTVRADCKICCYSAVAKCTGVVLHRLCLAVAVAARMWHSRHDFCHITNFRELLSSIFDCCCCSTCGSATTCNRCTECLRLVQELQPTLRDWRPRKVSLSRGCALVWLPRRKAL
jgi:hypothetical protein